MSEFVQGILVGVALALAAGALALYLGRVNSGSPGGADEPTGGPERNRPKPLRERGR